MNSVCIEGGCLCGAVRYRVRSEPGIVLNCHCTDCRKATGAPFMTWAVFPRHAVEWSGPAARRVPWADRLRLSCPQCGTPLGILPAEQADIVVLATGTMDRPEGMRPACDVWTQDHLAWVPLAANLPHHAAGLPVASAAPASA
jgi:hypothetical protein